MKKLVILLLVGLFIQVGNVSANITETFYAIQDEMVDSEGTYNIGDLLSTQGNSTFTSTTASVRRSLLQFNISSIPDNADIISAYFYIRPSAYTEAGTGASGASTEVHYVDDDTWDLTSSTVWVFNYEDLHFIDEQRNINVDNADDYIEWNLGNAGYGSDDWWTWTRQAQDLQDNLLSLMIMAEAESTDNYARFFSSEYSSGQDYWPKVVITYTVIPEPSSIILGSLGIGVFGALRRRKTL